jgi:hypothetical protein
MVLRNAKVFKNGEAVPEADVLECARDSKGCNLVRPKASYVAVQETDLTFGGAVKAANQVKNGSLSGPVGAYESHQFTTPESQIKVAHSSQAAEKVGQVFYFQKHFSFQLSVLSF